MRANPRALLGAFTILGVAVLLRRAVAPQYHPVGDVPQNVVYFDEYRVGGAGGSYAEVAPGGGRPFPNP